MEKFENENYIGKGTVSKYSRKGIMRKTVKVSVKTTKKLYLTLKNLTINITTCINMYI